MNLNAGKIIYTLLSASTVAQKVTKISPLVLEKAAKYPYIVYKRMSADDDQTKDGLFEDTTRVEVNIITNSYPEGLALANEVAGILPTKNKQVGDFYVNSLELADADEAFILNAYVQTLSFTIKTKK